MTPAVTKSIIDGIIVREGNKFTNNPADKGGPTKYGITQKTLSGWRGAEIGPKDVEQLEESEARQIYEAEYIKKPRFALINNDDLAFALIDFGVTSGPDDAVKTLQKLLNTHANANLKVDGVLGPKTAEAANSFGNAAKLRNMLIDARILFHIQDTEKRPNQLQFLEGWVNRCLSFRVY